MGRDRATPDCGWGAELRRVGAGHGHGRLDPEDLFFFKQKTAYEIEMHRVLARTGNGWTGKAGVDRQCEVELDAFRVQGVIRGIARRHLDAERHDPRERTRIVARYRLESAHLVHETQWIDAHRECEPFGKSIDEI